MSLKVVIKRGLLNAIGISLTILLSCNNIRLCLGSAVIGDPYNMNYDHRDPSHSYRYPPPSGKGQHHNQQEHQQQYQEGGHKSNFYNSQITPAPYDSRTKPTNVVGAAVSFQMKPPHHIQQEQAQQQALQEISSRQFPVEQRPRIPFNVNVEQMALALRYTGELNRQLHQGRINESPFLRHLHMEEIEEADPSPFIRQQQQHQRYSPQFQDVPRGGTISNNGLGQGMSSPPPPPVSTSAWKRPSIRIRPTSSLVQEKLTVFHAKNPRRHPSSSKTSSISRRSSSNNKNEIKQYRGAARWGPSLDMYIQHVLNILLDDGGDIGSESSIKDDVKTLVLALAMIYMDKACSIETSRTFDETLPPLPCICPRTVHRLVLTALVIAAKRVKSSMSGNVEEEEGRWYAQIEQTMGISKEQIHDMEKWMIGSLGDYGLEVSQEQLYGWLHSWDKTFNNNNKSEESKIKIRRKALQQQ